MENEIKGVKKEIQRLIDGAGPLFTNHAINYIANNLEIASKIDEFYKIDEKYANIIFEQSSLKIKDEIKTEYNTKKTVSIKESGQKVKDDESKDETNKDDKNAHAHAHAHSHELSKSFKMLVEKFDTKEDVSKETNPPQQSNSTSSSSTSQIKTDFDGKIAVFQSLKKEDPNSDQNKLDSTEKPKESPLNSKIEIYENSQSKNKTICIEESHQKDQKPIKGKNHEDADENEEEEEFIDNKIIICQPQKDNKKLQNDQIQVNDQNLESDQSKHSDPTQHENQAQKSNNNNNNDDDDDDDDDDEEDDDDDDEDDDDDDEEKPPKPNNMPEIILCTACNKEIDKKDLIYYNDVYPYHVNCIKCKECKEFKFPEDLANYKCITQGLFLCRKHYEQYQASKELPNEILEEYHSKKKENFIKEIFEQPFSNDDEILNDNVEHQDDEYFITSDIVDNLIPKDQPYEDFIPTATFKFDKQPQDIDFDELQKLLGDELIIINVEHGCTILKIAFLSIKKLSQKVIDTFKNLVHKFKDKLVSTIGKPVVGNIIDEKLITDPNIDNIKDAYNKPSLNLLQNTSELNSIDIDTMKNEVLGILHKEKVKKNWSFIFSHEQIFKQVEEQVRRDLKTNEFEMIIVGQTIIANKNLNEYNRIKNQIPKENIKEMFLYHGSNLSNHQKIVKIHFKMPGQDQMDHVTDSGYYGKGIYATENLFYAARYANGYKDLEYNDKTHVICCMAIYNDSKVKNLNCLILGQPIGSDIKDNFGIHLTFVGSSVGFYPVPETEEIKNKNYTTAHEYVFPNKYQIIPICSFTLMRKDHYILWKDENITNNENANYLNELSKKIEVNVYSESDVDKALNIIRNKRKNKIKLITNGGVKLSGKDLILRARKITQSNFVCLVFANSPKHYDWVKELENVLFTTSPADFKEFAAIDLSEKPIMDFVHKIENCSGRKFKINPKELLNFPLTSKSNYQ